MDFQIAKMSKRELLSYLIGVILGDGCIYINTKDKKHHMYQLSITTEDMDMCVFCEKIIKIYFNTKCNIKKVFKNNKISYYQLICCSKKICLFFKRLTKNRMAVPFLNKKNYRKYICIGLMDSDGWISKVSASDGYCRYRVGFKNTNKIFTEYLKDNLEKNNIKCGKIQQRKNKRLDKINKDSYAITINTKDYCNNLFFLIKRKEKLRKLFLEKQLN